MAMIELSGVKKSYGEKTVYNGLNLTFNKDKITAVLGVSGSGKTTLLNMIANLTPYEGKISGNDAPVSFVFQKPRLVKNLTVEQNLRLVCPDIDAKAQLKKVKMEDSLNAYPKSLSEGMARRVSILRAFCFDCKVLLMDEPFVNLDIALKFSLLNTVKQMQAENPKTVVFVTHDVKEAVEIADRIVVLDKGQVVFDTEEINEKTEKELFGLMITLGEN